jgi:hypothetical protein
MNTSLFKPPRRSADKADVNPWLLKFGPGFLLFDANDPFAKRPR